MYQFKYAGEERDEAGKIVVLFISLNQTYLPIINQIEIKGNISFYEAIIQIDQETSRQKALCKDIHELPPCFVNKVAIEEKCPITPVGQEQVISQTTKLATSLGQTSLLVEEGR